MTRLEPNGTIEAKVGATRHQSKHIGRAVSSEQRVYILHSQDCVDTGRDLRVCPYSVALDEGIQTGTDTPWEDAEDKPVELEIDENMGDLIPAGIVCHICNAKPVTVYTHGRRYCDDHGFEDDPTDTETTR